MNVSYLPIPSPLLGGSRCREPRVPGRVRRVAYYGPLAITYDCHDSPTDGETDRDVLDIAFVPNDRTAGRPGIHNPDLLLHQALEALQTALHITADELIENAPSREEA
ncbi:hypothetical protein EI77_04262 [Prosthecobacter fusiformis]|uniref:Uncharacterized protein n=1 Tax=Prosthecobacter fusiformis TaxID=48464 RepID=A0A4R7RIZ7_9BACT|nr:hypothetical protein [Prosthecobacter fusiformis]TDU64078.1 hypothetical protein EI77_04262 [Prosthecobacter fusiformis]